MPQAYILIKNIGVEPQDYAALRHVSFFQGLAITPILLVA